MNPAFREAHRAAEDVVRFFADRYSTRINHASRLNDYMIIDYPIKPLTIVFTQSIEVK